MWLWLRLTPFHLFAVLAIAVCVVGGIWQFGSYEDHQGSAVREAEAEATVPINDVWAVGKPFATTLENRSVEVSGRFAPTADQFWVQGDVTGGPAWLVAPFLVAGGDSSGGDSSDGALLVVRGQAPAAGELPPVPEGEQQLDVVLRPSIGGGSPLDDQRVTSSLTVPSLLNELPHRLWSGYGIVTDGPEGTVPTGFDRVAPPDPDVSWTVGLKNLAYALQWWTFALFALVMWWRMSSDMVADRRANPRP